MDQASGQIAADRTKYRRVLLPLSEVSAVAVGLELEAEGEVMAAGLAGGVELAANASTSTLQVHPR